MPWKEPGMGRLILMAIISLFSGGVRYTIDVMKGNQKPDFFALIGNFIVSGFVGFMAGLLVMESVESTYAAMAISGICGSMGADLLKLAQDKIKGRVESHE
ncbi:phage holin family protein [Cronobacter turicensis]